MKVAVLLLSANGCYTSFDGKTLPARPHFDKQLLLNVVRNRKITCSVNTYLALPPSIKNAVQSIAVAGVEDWEVNLGIKTFEQRAEIFIIVKSNEEMEGKFFRKQFLYDEYDLIYSNTEIEIWFIKGSQN